MGSSSLSTREWGINVEGGGSGTEDGHLFVPEANLAPTYDDDGNLTRDSRWSYAWDAENRLVTQDTLSAAIASALPEILPELRLEYTYDDQGRRFKKEVYRDDVLESREYYLYDGWNLIATLDASKTLTRSYYWGNDISGSRQGAGGVGGLLACSDDTSMYYYSYDGNGNVMNLINADTEAVEATYEYGPFGELLRSSGPQANSNPFRFSTKFTDDETGLVYYGFRYYESHKLFKAGETLAEQRMWKGQSKSIQLGLEKDLYVAIPRGQYDLLKANMDVDTDIVAPIDQGQQVGAVKITLKGEAYLDKPLVALQANPKGGLWRRIVDFFLRLFS